MKAASIVSSAEPLQVLATSLGHLAGIADSEIRAGHGEQDRDAFYSSRYVCCCRRMPCSTIQRLQARLADGVEGRDGHHDKQDQERLPQQPHGRGQVRHELRNVCCGVYNDRHQQNLRQAQQTVSWLTVFSTQSPASQCCNGTFESRVV
jgi:hypothetical protein